MSASDDLLRMAWSGGFFDLPEFSTTDGVQVVVVDRGEYNPATGLMEDARIRIGGGEHRGVIAVGSDTVHRKAILQVLSAPGPRLLGDGDVFVSQAILPLPDCVAKRHEALLRHARSAECRYDLAAMKSIDRRQLFDRLMSDRFDRKCEEIRTIYDLNKDWLGTLYASLFRSMGVPDRKETFAALYGAIPLRALFNERNPAAGIEALIFGASGLLPGDDWDPYVVKLNELAAHLLAKYQITPLKTQLWQTARSSNPRGKAVIRLAQLSSIVASKDFLLNEVLECCTVKDLHGLFDVQASEYWSTHYLPDGKETPHAPKRLGTMWSEILGINMVAPLMVVYGRINGREDYHDRAIKLLESIPAESNAVIKAWRSPELALDNAYDSQAILQLHKEYCAKSLCTDCLLGRRILRREWEKCGKK